ncbi:MAG: hypothetical protein MJE77_14315 [Proteobacteria bacterium]|nr:hypothetical protein [Pseudomonadota bacterium]
MKGDAYMKSNGSKINMLQGIGTAKHEKGQESTVFPGGKGLKDLKQGIMQSNKYFEFDGKIEKHRCIGTRGDDVKKSRNSMLGSFASHT